MILSCSNLSVADRVRTVLRRFDFAIGPGEIRTLIGPNGSGKSTALQALAGLLTPGDGTVTVDGRPIATMRRRDLARRLAFLPQQPSAPDEMTVEHLVRHGRFAHVRLFRNDRAAEAAAIRWALDSTGLWTLAGRSLRELSGGERQRAWISTAIAQEARILLLDEPTSFLDIGHQVEILDLVHRLSRERGIAVVMAVHDLNQAMAISDGITLLDKGRVVYDRAPGPLAGAGLIERVFNVKGRFVPSDETRAPRFETTLAAPWHGAMPRTGAS